MSKKSSQNKYNARYGKTGANTTDMCLACEKYTLLRRATGVLIRFSKMDLLLCTLQPPLYKHAPKIAFEYFVFAIISHVTKAQHTPTASLLSSLLCDWISMRIRMNTPTTIYKYIIAHLT